MDALILGLVFAAALAVSGCVVLVFSIPVDDVIRCLISGAMAQAWSRYVKFAVFTASFVGGMRLAELSAFVARTQPLGGQPLVSDGQGLLEVYKTISGALGAASATLLVFFAATLAACVVLRAYEHFRPGTGRRVHARKDLSPQEAEMEDRPADLVQPRH